MNTKRRLSLWKRKRKSLAWSPNLRRRSKHGSGTLSLLSAILLFLARATASVSSVVRKLLKNALPAEARNSHRRKARFLGVEKLVGRVLYAADLVPTALSAPAEGVLGETMEVATTLANQGNRNSGEVKYRLYLSGDATITKSDKPLGTFTLANVEATPFAKCARRSNPDAPPAETPTSTGL